MHSEGRLAARSGVGNGLCWLATCHARRRSLTLIWLVCAPSSIDKHRQFRVCKHLQRLTSQDHRDQASAAVRGHRYKIAGLSSSSIDDRLIDVFVPYRQCIAGNTKHLSPICGCREISACSGAFRSYSARVLSSCSASKEKTWNGCKTLSNVTRAPTSLANASVFSTAAFERREPSVGTRMCSYI